MHGAGRRKHDRIRHLPPSGIARLLWADLDCRMGCHIDRRHRPRHPLRAPGAHGSGDGWTLHLYEGGLRRVRRVPDRLGILDRALGRQCRGRGRVHRLPWTFRAGRIERAACPFRGTGSTLVHCIGEHPWRRVRGRGPDRRDAPEAAAASGARHRRCGARGRVPPDPRQSEWDGAAFGHCRVLRADLVGLPRSGVRDCAGG